MRQSKQDDHVVEAVLRLWLGLNSKHQIVTSLFLARPGQRWRTVIWSSMRVITMASQMRPIE